MNNTNSLEYAISAIIEFLNALGDRTYIHHVNFLQQLLDALRRSETSFFTKEINSVELWGGSGALWESQDGMTTEQYAYFKTLLLKLLLSMKENDILEKRGKSVFKLIN